MSSEIQLYTKVNLIHNSIVPGPNLGLIALIERSVLASPRFGTELDGARRPGRLSKKKMQRAPSAGNYFNLYQARENMQLAHRAGKQATGAKRGKTFSRHKERRSRQPVPARENMSLEPVSSAGKVACTKSQLRGFVLPVI